MPTPRDRVRAALALTLALGACGCSPTLSTMRPARLVPAGHVELGTSFEASLPSGEIRDALDRARGISGELTRADVGLLADAATAALVHSPGIGNQISLAYGVSRRVELDARVSMTAVRGGLRVQLLRVKPGIYVALGVGVTHQFVGLPIQRFTSAAELRSFSRQELDVPLTAGFSSRAFHLWLGPKLVVARYDASVSACLDRQDGLCAMPATMALEGTAAYLAGQIGLAIGWKSVWLAAELTVARLGVDATMQIDSAAMHEAHTFGGGGLVLAPAVGLFAWF